MFKKTLAIGFLIAFLGGLAFGYAIWREKDIKPKDALTLLNEAIDRVEEIDREHRQFAEELAANKIVIQEAEKLKTDAEIHQRTVEGMQAENTRLTGLIDQLKQNLIQGQEALKVVDLLGKENASLKEKINQLTLQKESGETSEQISDQSANDSLNESTMISQSEGESQEQETEAARLEEHLTHEEKQGENDELKKNIEEIMTINQEAEMLEGQ
ncbi:hypothetical protein ACFL6N_00340 [Thermodesulfobacteriota bacterium]